MPLPGCESPGYCHPKENFPFLCISTTYFYLVFQTHFYFFNSHSISTQCLLPPIFVCLSHSKAVPHRYNLLNQSIRKRRYFLRENSETQKQATSVRTIPFGDTLCNALKKEKAEQLKNELKYGEYHTIGSSR